MLFAVIDIDVDGTGPRRSRRGRGIPTEGHGHMDQGVCVDTLQSMFQRVTPAEAQRQRSVL